MDSTCRTLSNTLLAEFALSIVNVCEIVLYSDCFERTYLSTLAAAYAGSLAGLTCSCALVLVHA